MTFVRLTHVVHLFLLQRGIQLDEYNTMYLFILLLIGLGFFSSLGQL